jgi:2-phosphosulfolactate phosphatase
VELFVYHTPEQTPSDSLPDCAVVIDVLRATTTIATALNAGADSVQTFPDIDELMRVSEKWDPNLRIRAGERGGAKVQGCDMGNSPRDCTPTTVTGKRLFISTTNGTRCLNRVAKANTVITASQINRQATVNFILTHQPETVWLIGSGWQGTYSLEDTACAGAIACGLEKSLSFKVGNDEVIASQSLYTKWQNNLLELFHLSSHGQRLLRLEQNEDIEYCSQSDILDIVPIQKESSVLVKWQKS